MGSKGGILLCFSPPPPSSVSVCVFVKHLVTIATSSL